MFKYLQAWSNFRNKKDFVLKSGFIPEKFKPMFKGGLGAVMLVDYESSDAGPYGELLFIPGKFNYKGKSKYIITKIYVSTQISVESGIANCAIPKEPADFVFSNIANAAKHESIKIENGGNPFFEAEIKTGVFPFLLHRKKTKKHIIQHLKGRLPGGFAK